MGRLDPRGPIRGQAAGRDEEMGVRMIREAPRPGVEHSEDAEAGADPLWVVGERFAGKRPPP
jgi:hypothetical protein